MSVKPKTHGFDTLTLHAGARPDPATGARATPIYQTTSFVFDDTDDAAALFNMERAGHVYSRLSNPTCAVLEERIAALEGGIGDRLIGGRGTLVNADPRKAPIKTVESYWPYATTLFDYVKRAMPLTAPGSLTDDQVYALTAYILFEANIVADDVIMNAETLPKVVMPNVDGFMPDHRPEHFPPVAKTPHQSLGIVK